MSNMFKDKIPLLAKIFGKRVVWYKKSRSGRIINIKFIKRWRGIFYVYKTIDFEGEKDES